MELVIQKREVEGEAVGPPMSEYKGSYMYVYQIWLG